MGLYDREYTQEGGSFRGGGYSPQMNSSFGNLPPATMWILVLNVAIFLLQSLLFGRYPSNQLDPIEAWFSVLPVHFGYSIQIWRLVTYQFLHGGLMHLLFNMIGVFFLGPILERNWGTKRFIWFYLGCGISGGLLYIILASIGLLGVGPMVGASGSLLGLLAACAILFPGIVVFLIIFPVPIRVAAVILGIIAMATVFSDGHNSGGEAAHLGGLVAGTLYVFSQSWRKRIVVEFKGRANQRTQANDANMQSQIDKILDKVHEHGIHSLSQKERNLLRKATEMEQKRKKHF